jgi:hypothetical protein
VTSYDVIDQSIIGICDMKKKMLRAEAKQNQRNSTYFNSY